MKGWQDPSVVDRPAGEASRWERWGGARTVGLLLLLLVVSIRLADPAPVELARVRLFDLYMSLFAPNPVTNHVVIVDIDEDSLRSAGQWPWPRSALADLVEILAKNGARTVGFDMIFPEPDQVSPVRLAETLDALAPALRDALSGLGDNDARFAQSMQSVPVVLGYTLRPDIGSGNEIRPPLAGRIAVRGPASAERIANYPAAVRNIDTLEQGAAGLGLVNALGEPDGIVRRIPLALRIDGVLQPSLAAEILRVAQGRPGLTLHTDRWFGVTGIGFGSWRVPTDERGRVWINYGAGNPLVTLSAGRLLDGDPSVSAVRDKIVLVGSSALAVGDIWTVASAEAAPGVQIYARAVNNLISGAVPTRPGFTLGVELLVVLAAGLYLLWDMRRRSVQGKLLLFLAFAAAIVAASVAAYAVTWTLFDPTFPVAACLVILLYLGYRDFLRAEHRLRRSGAFMHRIVDNSFDAILAVDSAGSILTANPAALVLLGATGDQEGLALDRFLSPADGVGDRLRIADLVERGTAEAVIRGSDGRQRAVELTVNPIRNDPFGASIVVMRDISDRKLAEAAASRALERLMDAIESIPEGFALVEAAGRLTLCNRRFAEIVGASHPAALIGQPFRAVLRGWATGPSDPLSVEGGIESWLDKCEQRLYQPAGPCEEATRDGHWLRIDEQPTSDGGTVALFTDLDELKQRETQLLHEKARAEQANIAKSRFLANVSHELLTPLNAIIGFTDIMASAMFGPIDNPRYRGYLGDVQKSSNHLLGLIEDLIDLSRLDLDVMRIDEVPVDVAQVVAEAVILVELQAAEGGVAIEQIALADLPALLADRTMIKQIVLNLLTNAVKFTPRGGCVTASVTLQADRGLAITVADTGIGIDSSAIVHMTEPFWRSDDATRRDYPGVGLGLALVDSFVRRHGGRLEITSAVGAGTVASVYFDRTRTLSECNTASGENV